MKKLLILVLIPFFAIACDGQSRTNRLYRPCPNSSTPAIVEVEADGDINVRPCSGKTLQQNGTPINIAQPFELIAAASDETTAITAAATGLPVRIADNALICVAMGAGQAFEEPVYRNVLMAA